MTEIPQGVSLDTHVLARKQGHEEWLHKNTWDRIEFGKDGTKDGYELVNHPAKKPAEIDEIRSTKDIKMVKKADPVIDEVLVNEVEEVEEVAEVAEAPVKLADAKAKPAKGKKK